MIQEFINIINKTKSDNFQNNLIANISEGYSGEKLLYILQESLKKFKDSENICYLEIGVFKGLTLLSVASANQNYTCYGIDNFSFFNKDGTNYQTVNKKIQELKLNNVHILDMDYEDALDNLNKHIKNQKIAVYFIDGPHDYRSQLMCLYLAKPYLQENAIIVIDDSNYSHVRQANRDFLFAEKDFKLIFEAYTKCHPMNMNKDEEISARAGWWNGVNIIVRDPQNKLNKMYPVTERDRKLFINEHIIQSMALAHFAPLGLLVLQKLSESKFISLLKILIKNFRKLKNERLNYKYNNANTESQSLPNFNVNNLIK